MNNLNNIRLFLWLTFAGMAWLTYTAWNADYGARPGTTPALRGTRRPGNRDTSRAARRDIRPTAIVILMADSGGIAAAAAAGGIRPIGVV